MILVLFLSALVACAVGAILGLVVARFLPKVLLYVLWAALTAGALYQFLQTNMLDDYERAGANIVLFSVLLPLLIGSLITGTFARHR